MTASVVADANYTSASSAATAFTITPRQNAIGGQRIAVGHMVATRKIGCHILFRQQRVEGNRGHLQSRQRFGRQIPFTNDMRIHRGYVKAHHPFVLAHQRVFHERACILLRLLHLTTRRDLDVPRTQIVIDHDVPQPHLTERIDIVGFCAVGQRADKFDELELLIEFVHEFHVLNVIVDELLMVLTIELRQ